MLDYIWIDDKTSILNQIKGQYKYASIITNPFIQMPQGWYNNKKISGHEFTYPTNEEIIEYGKPVLWSQILKQTELENLRSLALAMKTYISALNKFYARFDLMEKFKLGLQEDVYLPNEDKISQFLFPTIIEVFKSKGITKIQYSEPIYDTSGEILIDDITIQNFYEMAPSEIIVTDETNDTVFLSVYDSFITLMLSNDKNTKEIIISAGWEAIECNEDTMINWYLN
ncbi:DUF2711 domain-containing protein [Paenibacillus sp. N1-5-1-14]|uniref:DUF2711 domain-containing protein n=1 Tax=Paenibacillus radicibacter TaxID=2972488 RepID=UPI002158A6F0|nr:DUF2711 domain-containing protein [Paenibacillus radicibacter]MCR8645516.1 DUF2711 domain-containing protein [Paenibacillus radicibacter]